VSVGEKHVVERMIRATGFPLDMAEFLASGVVAVDVGTQGTDPASAHKHAMGGMKGRYSGGQEAEGCSEAYDGAIRNLNQDIANRDIMGALHEIEDSYASGHLYQPWTGVQSAAHKTGDQVIVPAAEAAAQAFLTALRKNKPLGKAQDYLAPRPANCK